jgi:hypothetical protein
VRGFVDGECQDGELRGLAFLAGKRGMGKTTEMDRLLSACSGGVVFFDTLSKHGEALKGYKIVSEPGEMKSYLARNYKQRFRIMYQPRRGNLDAHFEACAAIVEAFGWMIFGVDEIDKLCGPRWGDSRMPPKLYDLVNYGRHHRVSMLATARKPQRLSRDYAGECHEMRLFQITEPAALDYFEEYIGKVNTAKLRSIPKYQYLLWSDDHDGESKLCGGRR